MAPSTYTARGDGSRLLLVIRERRVSATTSLRIDKVSLRKVKQRTPAPAGSGDVLKVLNSTSASSSTDCVQGGGTLSRAGLGDSFFIPQQPVVQTTRCTWVNDRFSQMGRHEIFDVNLRWDQYSQADSSHIGVIYVRPAGQSLSSGCDGGGNQENILVRIYVDWATNPNRWMVDLRGGESPWPVDQDPYFASVPLGPVVAGDVLNLKFDLFFDDAHGAATIWRDGALVYDNRDRPLGFHYDCTYRASADASPQPGATDLSTSSLRVQHGIYRNASPAWELSSSGFRFYCSQTGPC